MKRILSAATPATLAVIVSLALPLVSSAKKPGGGGGGGDTSLQYSIVRLDDAGGLFVGSPSAGAEDINEWGHVVGSVADAVAGTSVAAFWEVSGTTSQIVPLADGSFAFGLNNWNEIVGLGYGNALYWPSPNNAPVTLPPLAVGLASVAYGINDDGIICGYARHRVVDEDGNVTGATDAAVVWRVTYASGELRIAGPVLLPTFDYRSQAYAVSENDTGGVANIVGVFITDEQGYSGSLSKAVRWTVTSHADGTISVDPNPLLLEIGEAVVFGVNNLGVSCGQALLSSTDPKARVWLGNSGLTLLDPPSIPHYVGWPLHKALDVNDVGIIVGSAGANAVFRDAVVWSSAAAQPVLLGDFLKRRNAPFGRLKTANAINESGVIVGVGTNGSDDYGFLAIPK